MRCLLVTSLMAVVCVGALNGCGDDDPARPAVDPIAALPVSESVHLQGLPATSDIVFDELGIPHVYGPDTETTIFLQGYVTASMRFWEMDVFRRFALGRLAELFGPTLLAQDVQLRTLFTTRDGRRLEEALWEHLQQVDPEASSVARAYAAGVNAWLADLRAGRNGATLPPEYTVPLVTDVSVDELFDWRPQDTLAIARLQAFSLSESMEEEIDRARIERQVPEALRLDVFRSAPAAPATVLPAHNGAARTARERQRIAMPKAPSLDTLNAVSASLKQLRQTNPLQGGGDVGSNNWIIAPALSANGHAMLANDPHLQLFNPPIWHMIQLNVGTEEMRDQTTGVMFPGLPGIILGHNEYGAWGGTVAVFDVTDVYVEDVSTPDDYPNSPRTVLFNGRQVPVLRIEETFKIKRHGAVKQIIEVVPHHGPMVPDPDITDHVVGLAATNMSVRWTGHEITEDSRFLLGLNRAHNVAEFKEAVRSFAVGAQNWVWADVSGDIAYFPRVLIPQRPPGTVPYLPMPGTGEAEWLTDAQGHTLWLPEEKIPQAFNPPEGFLATANNDQIGNTLDNDPLNDEIYLTYSADLGFREQRIQELLSNRANVRPVGAKMSAADMSHYQYDTSSKEAIRLLPFLFTAAEHRPDLVDSGMADALARLRAWATEKPGSPACDAVSGIDAHDLRADAAARPLPVSDEERADAIAMSLFAGWSTRLAPAVLADDFAGTGVGAPTGDDPTKALLHILEDVDRSDDNFKVHTLGGNGESTLWDDKSTSAVETRDEILLASLRGGLTFLGERFASPQPQDWLWGKIHQVVLQHFIGEAGISLFNLGPFAAPGSRFTVNPGGFGLSRNSSFTFSGGPSERFVAILDPAGVRSFNTLPGGNNGNPGGVGDEKFNHINPQTHYGDLLPGWINGQTFEYHVSRSAVAAHAVHRVQYTP